ncbi:MAG: hypothetical protein QOF94_1640, partial [Acidobacteriaceae bacterium]
LGNGEGKLQLERCLQIGSFKKRFKTVVRHAQRISSGLEIGRCEFADGVGGKHEWLVEISTSDLDARTNDDCAGGILDGSGEGL